MKKLPTKEEIKAARELRRQGRAMIAKAVKVLIKVDRTKHRKRRRPLNPKDLEFRTWLHDVRVLLPAAARTVDADMLSVYDLVSSVSSAADEMKREVEARRPVNTRVGVYEDDLQTEWQEWQEMFDNLVHGLSDRSEFAAEKVVVRAASLADEMIKEIEKRRPPTKRKK